MTSRLLPLLLILMVLLTLLGPSFVAGQMKKASEVAVLNGTSGGSHVNVAAVKHQKRANANTSNPMENKSPNAPHYTNAKATKVKAATPPANTTANAAKAAGRKQLNNSTRAVKKVGSTRNGAGVVMKVHQPVNKAQPVHRKMVKTNTPNAPATPGRLLLGRTPNAAHPRAPEHHATTKAYKMPNATTTATPGRLL